MQRCAVYLVALVALLPGLSAGLPVSGELAATASVAPAPPPVQPLAMATLKPFNASYEVRLNNLPFRADARQALVPLGNDRWRLTLTVESFLLDTTEYSEFRWDGATCHTIPERYGYSRNGIGRDKYLDMRFDFATGTLTRNNGSKSTEMKIGKGVEDKLGHSLALACRVARGARGLIGVDVAWDNDVRHFDYLVAPVEETIVTPLASYRALRMERKRADDDRITSTWLSAGAGWRTVRMQHSEGDGRLFQLQLLELNNGN
jgi:hypothetical protein